jgi:hypothetical protein
LIFTPHYAASTPRAEGNVEAVLRVEKPIGVVPLPRYAAATVVDVRDSGGGTSLLFDQVVLAARDKSVGDFLRSLRPGEVLGISREITDLGFGCRREGSVDWSDVYAAIGGGFVFLRDGAIRTGDDIGASIRDPRTAVCLNQDFVYFVVVDGRKNGQPGMTWKSWRVL